MTLLPWSSPADFAARAVAFDTETYLIEPGNLAPKLVLGSVADADTQRTLSKDDTARTFLALLCDPRVIVIGANIAFDCLVMAVEWAKRGRDIIPEIFAAYEAGRIYDVQHAEMLNAIADGKLGLDPFTGKRMQAPDPATGKMKDAWYSLWICVSHVLGRDDAKANDEWRLRYSELDGVTLDQLPATAYQYPMDDARNTWDVAAGQVGYRPKRVRHAWNPETRMCAACGAAPGPVAHCFTTRPHRNLHDLAAQTYSAWALHLGAAWGFAVDGPSVDALEASVSGDRVAELQRMIAAGYLRKARGTTGPTKDTALVKRTCALAYGAKGVCVTCKGTCKVPSAKTKGKINCTACCVTGFADLGVTPRTEPTAGAPHGNVQIGRDALHESGDDGLIALADFEEDRKLLETYVPYLRKGTALPINLRPNVLLETGRVSYRDPIQQLPRKGGIRDCFTARPGTVYVSVDYDSGELVTHAQSCLWICGESALATALVGGAKPHSVLGAQMIGAPYDDFEARMTAKDPFAKDARQAAKPGNFGFPGGMGAAKLVLQQRKQGPDTVCPGGPADLGDGVRGYKGLRFCVLMDGAERCGDVKVTSYRAGTREFPCPPTCLWCIECAQRLREHWFSSWPENRTYFRRIDEWVDGGMPLPDALSGLGPLAPNEIAQHRSWRIRGGVEFTSAANGFFQGLLADIAKAALRRAQRECYDRTARSVLYGSRVILFAHDELIAELPERHAHEAATRLSEIMVAEMVRYCPDLAPAAKAEPALMRRWFKGAEPKRDESGRLVCWEPKAA